MPTRLPISSPLQHVTGAYDERLSKPLPDHSEIIDRLEVFGCTGCGSHAAFVTYRATDCDLWGLIGLDGATSNAYGDVHCPACADGKIR